MFTLMCNISGLSPAPFIKVERLRRTADKTLFTIPALTSTVSAFIEDSWSKERGKRKNERKRKKTKKKKESYLFPSPLCLGSELAKALFFSEGISS